MSPWSPAQIRHFIEATGKDRLGVLWRLLALTSLGSGEACGIRWADVDLDGRRVNIDRARVMAGGKVVNSTPKTDPSARSIGLDPQTVLALRIYKARQWIERLATGNAWANDVGWVFSDEVGRPVHPTKASKLLIDAVIATKMPRIRLHDLRHSYATAASRHGFR
jgi:integrase